MIEFDSYLNEVHYLLLNYIKLHDKVFDNTTICKKFIKTFFPIKFQKIKDQLDIIKQNLNYKESEIKQLFNNNASIEERNLLRSLIEFISSLQITINYFDVILIGLVRKSENLSYSIDDYKNDYQIYTESISVYRQNGDYLNQAFTKYIRYCTNEYMKNNKNNV